MTARAPIPRLVPIRRQALEYLGGAVIIIAVVIVLVALVRRRSARFRWVLLLVLVAWLGIGRLRPESVAREYLAHAHGAAATVSHVEVHGLIPLIPPFWGVSIEGAVQEPQMVAAGDSGYISAMLLCIEPLTGWVLVCGSG